MTRLEPDGHEKVARAFRGGAGEVRRLDVEEVVRLHHPPDDGNSLRPGADGLRGAGPTQVQVAVTPAGRLVDAAVDRVRSVDRERRGLALAQDLDVCGDHLHLAGRQVGGGVALGPLAHLAVDADAPLAAQCMGMLGRRALAEDDLHDAAGVPQVDEDDAAVVAPARDPPRQGDRRARVLAPQLTGLMRADHEGNLFRSTSPTSSIATASSPPSRRSLTWPPPSGRSRPPATSAYVAAERSAAFIAPFSPRS